MSGSKPAESQGQGQELQQEGINDPSLPAAAGAVEGGKETPAPAGEEVAGVASSPTSNPPWFQRRIDGLTARLRTEEQAHASTKQQLTMLQASHTAISAELARLKGTAPSPTVAPGSGPSVSAGGPQPMTQEEIEALVDQRAAERLAIQTSKNAELESISRGKAAYPDFESTVANLKNLGGLPTGAFEMAIESGAAEHIFYSLGKDLEKASQIFEMPQGKMAVELAKLATAPAKSPPPASGASKAPAPMTPVGGKGVAGTKDLADSKLAMEEWLASRNAQLAEAKAQGRVRH